jgi:uncharacterized protein (DUF4415 family)
MIAISIELHRLSRALPRDGRGWQARIKDALRRAAKLYKEGNKHDER